MTFEIGQILKIRKMTLPQKNGSRIKTPSSKVTILVSDCLKKQLFHSVSRFLEIIDRKCSILSGTPCMTCSYLNNNVLATIIKTSRFISQSGVRLNPNHS